MQFLAGASLPQLPFVVVDAESGEIRRTGLAPAELVERQAQHGEAIFVGYANDASQYIDIGTAAVLNKLEISPVVSGLAITGLPNHCTAHVESQCIPVTNGELTLWFDVPGTYRVRFSAPCWLDAIVELVQP